ncbi:ligase-associated DNA damage response endonuclease PdeM [Algoriphagus namhaensis]
MKNNSVRLNHQNFTLELLREKVVWIKEKKILLLADLHFGKAAHFRKSGIPIPEPIHRQDLALLEELFQNFEPESVYFLGDLFHSDYNDQWAVLNEFLLRFSDINFHLVLGNHDILPGRFYEESCFEIHNQPVQLDSLLLSHEPMQEIEENAINVCGHIHPGLRLKGKARQSFRLPCFFLRRRQLILPAFGHFTGLALISPQAGEKAFAITPETVFAVNH